jgi:two-component system chemotaxis response regulator CheB
MVDRERLAPGRPPREPDQIEVLIVDDSAVVRQRLKAIVESDPRFRVVLAADPFEAAERLKRSVPGVIVLDVEMPRMDGLTFLRKLMRQHPMPVVLCTTQAERAVTALEMGAIEVIAKPDWSNSGRMSEWSRNLLEVISNAAHAGHLPLREERPPTASDRLHTADAILPLIPYSRHASTSDRMIAVGISTGGVQALEQMLPMFPADTPGIVIVQHMVPDFIPAFAARLGNNPKIAMEVGVARQGEPVRSGRVLMIPGEKHGLVRRVGGGYRIELVEGPLVTGFCPSVDVLFRSTAQAAGPFAVGVIMTGMRHDGAAGLLEMREAGAFTIAQNEATCSVFGMPREAIRRGAAKVVVPLDSIAATIVAWAASSL